MCMEMVSSELVKLNFDVLHPSQGSVTYIVAVSLWIVEETEALGENP